MYIERAYTDKGTFGQWYSDDGTRLCYSVERPWRNNQPFVSCIPEGQYGLREYDSPKFGNVLILVNTDLGVGLYPGEAQRSAILIHAANMPSELQGCIAPGSYLTSMNGEWAVADSRRALKKVMAVAESESIIRLRPARAVWSKTGQ